MIMAWRRSDVRRRHQRPQGTRPTKVIHNIGLARKSRVDAPSDADAFLGDELTQP